MRREGSPRGRKPSWGEGAFRESPAGGSKAPTLPDGRECDADEVTSSSLVSSSTISTLFEGAFSLSSSLPRTVCEGRGPREGGSHLGEKEHFGSHRQGEARRRPCPTEENATRTRSPVSSPVSSSKKSRRQKRRDFLYPNRSEARFGISSRAKPLYIIRRLRLYIIAALPRINFRSETV